MEALRVTSQVKMDKCLCFNNSSSIIIRCLWAIQLGQVLLEGTSQGYPGYPNMVVRPQLQVTVHQTQPQVKTVMIVQQW